MSHQALSPETQRVLKNHGVIAYTPSRMPAIFSFLLTGALFTAALLMSFGQVLADDGDDGRYYYDRYALPYVKAYAPPNTAPGTYGRSDDGEYWRGPRNNY
ncbi:hypothetical protein AUC71_01105 [Methyloceanibacter marginalis]|uniref:Uncharacterized protein n=1 Tax=Methyloceanibacter marginalis TaxID=1774971 RepID=A0A1E3WBM7_9HYPH|nr:hypothetical protein [Methyloceanibacter marginalis]ODS03219.1 hypothetical protein AUC71_01105 [Methyloceanibacter marginalis]